MDKIKPMIQYYPPRLFEVDPEFYPGGDPRTCTFHSSHLISIAHVSSYINFVPAEYDASRLMRKQLAEKRERLIELERRRLAGLRLESMPEQFAYFDCSIEDVSPLNSLPAGLCHLSSWKYTSSIHPSKFQSLYLTRFS